MNDDLRREEEYYKKLIATGGTFDIVCARHDLPYSLAPSVSLLDKWSTFELIDPLECDTFDEIARIIAETKNKTYPQIELVDRDTDRHPEVLDFTKAENINRFFWNDHEPLHVRRQRMTKDLVIYAIKKKLAEIRDRKVVVLDIGVGPLLLECIVQRELSGEDRGRVEFLGAFDYESGHRSFFTYHSLGKLFKGVGLDDEKIYIASNGVRLAAKTNNADYFAGIKGYTHVGDRLIFYVNLGT